MPVPGKTYRMLNQAIIELEALKAIVQATKKSISTVTWNDTKNSLRDGGVKLPTLKFHDTLIKDIDKSLAAIRTDWNKLCQKAQPTVSSTLFGMVSGSAGKIEEEHEVIEARLISCLTDISDVRTAYLAILEYFCRQDYADIGVMQNKISCIFIKAAIPDFLPQIQRDCAIIFNDPLTHN